MGEYSWYTSVAGIVTATVIIVGILKRALAAVEYLNSVPTWLYAVAVSCGLTAVTNLWWHTLPGDFWQLAMQAVIAAATATGFYEWFRRENVAKPLADSSTAVRARNGGGGL